MSAYDTVNPSKNHRCAFPKDLAAVVTLESGGQPARAVTHRSEVDFGYYILRTRRKRRSSVL